MAEPSFAVGMNIVGVVAISDCEKCLCGAGLESRIAMGMQVFRGCACSFYVERSNRGLAIKDISFPTGFYSVNAIEQ